MQNFSLSRFQAIKTQLEPLFEETNYEFLSAYYLNRYDCIIYSKNALLLNPKIVEKSAETTYIFESSPLCYDRLAIKRKRAERIKLAWLDPSGNLQHKDFTETEAIELQHQMMLLEGKNICTY